MRDEDGIERRLLASVSRAEGRRHLLDGNAADPATSRAAGRRSPSSRPTGWRWSRARRPSAAPTSTVSSPPAGPSRAELRQRFGQALAQRNALVARIAAGPRRGRPSSTPGTQRLAEAAAALIAARAEAVDELARAVRRRRRGARPGGRRGDRYAPRAAGSAEEIRAGLAERREADLRLGRSSWGPTSTS